MQSASIQRLKIRGFVLAGVLSSALVLDARLVHADVDAFGAKLPDAVTARAPSLGIAPSPVGPVSGVDASPAGSSFLRA